MSGNQVPFRSTATAVVVLHFSTCAYVCLVDCQSSDAIKPAFLAQGVSKITVTRTLTEMQVTRMNKIPVNIQRLPVDGAGSPVTLLTLRRRLR
ncbi:hypothetical protein TNCV_4855711 [Trichonephila clavipes]|nr:hypothetical protein TNCV_4855711 [Trichonephila clavipes]